MCIRDRAERLQTCHERRIKADRDCAVSGCLNAFAIIATFSSFFSFFLFPDVALSSHSEDGHEMYSGGSVVGEASLIDPEISPTPPLIFTGEGQEVRNFASFLTSLDFEPLAFENAARYLNSSVVKTL